MRFGLLEIREWFVVPQSEPASDPSELFSMLRDDIFILVNYRSYWKSQDLKDWRQLYIKAPVEKSMRIVLLISTPYLNFWAGYGHGQVTQWPKLTLASCSPVFFRSIKTLFSKKLPRDAQHCTAPLRYYALFPGTCWIWGAGAPNGICKNMYLPTKIWSFRHARTVCRSLGLDWVALWQVGIKDDTDSQVSSGSNQFSAYSQMQVSILVSCAIGHVFGNSPWGRLQQAAEQEAERVWAAPCKAIQWRWVIQTYRSPIAHEPTYWNLYIFYYCFLTCSGGIAWLQAPTPTRSAKYFCFIWNGTIVHGKYT